MGIHSNKVLKIQQLWVTLATRRNSSTLHIENSLEMGSKVLASWPGNLWPRSPPAAFWPLQDLISTKGRRKSEDYLIENVVVDMSWRKKEKGRKHQVCAGDYSFTASLLKEKLGWDFFLPLSCPKCQGITDFSSLKLGQRKKKKKVIVLQTTWGGVGQDVLVLFRQVFVSLHDHLKQNLIC